MIECTMTDAAGTTVATCLMVVAHVDAHSTPILIDGRPDVAAVMRGPVVSILAFDIDGDRIAGLGVPGASGTHAHRTTCPRPVA